MKNRGITIVSLVITLVVLLIVVGISVGLGGKMIRKSELENIKTNMLLIEVKAKEYVEKANFNLGAIDKIDIKNEEEKQQEIQKRIDNAKGELVGTIISDSSIFPESLNITNDTITADNGNYIYYYKLTTEDLGNMGFSNVKSDDDNGWYLVRYDVKNIDVEVYNTKGFEVEENTYYTANEIENLSL